MTLEEYFRKLYAAQINTTERAPGTQLPYSALLRLKYTARPLLNNNMIVRGHEIFSPILRVGELISAAIVVGILAGYEHYIDRANAPNNGRIVYSLVIASLTLLFSVILLIPFHASFYFFGMDFIFFITWMVAFGLMANASCSLPYLT